jgi:methyl-accepting chemotaxis protein
VKNLATRTAKATHDIKKQIGTVQRIVRETAGDIREIGGLIAENKAVAIKIAFAVTEQTAATQSIAANIQGAAVGTQQVTSSIADVSKAAIETREDVADVRTAAAALSSEADSLNSVVAGFLRKMRSAQLARPLATDGLGAIVTFARMLRDANVSHASPLYRTLSFVCSEFSSTL